MNKDCSCHIYLCKAFEFVEKAVLMFHWASTFSSITSIPASQVVERKRMSSRLFVTSDLYLPAIWDDHLHLQNVCWKAHTLHLKWSLPLEKCSVCINVLSQPTYPFLVETGATFITHNPSCLYK
ncbi:hypothetical protein QQ045_012890 [Rhodiola kirilowii]